MRCPRCWKPRENGASWSLAGNPTSAQTASIFASVPNDQRTSDGSSRQCWHLISQSAVELSISGVLMLLLQRRPPWPRSRPPRLWAVGSVLLLVQELARVESHRSPAPVADHAGCSAGRRRPFAAGRRAVTALGIGSRHCSGTPDVLGRAGGPGTRRHRCTTLPLISCGAKSPLPMERIRLRFVKGGDTWAVWSASAHRPRKLRLAWRTDGSYLITGGLGDLGLLVARWMVEQGARRLILLGRTKLPPRASWNSAEAGSRLASQIAAIRELESVGSLRASGLGRCGR